MTSHDTHSVPTIRFLVHGAERSGPPIYALRLLEQWRRDGASIAPSVVLARGGALEPAFRAAAPTTVASLGRRSPERLAQRALEAARVPGLGCAVLDLATRCRIDTRPTAITVVNGATQPTAELLRSLAPDGEVVLIAHELSTGWSDNVDAVSRALLLGRTDRYLAVSQAVADYLTSELAVPRDRITVTRPPTPLRTRSSPLRDSTVGNLGRWPRPPASPYTDHDVRGPAVVVGGAGVHDWRKAPELWLQVAARVRDRLGAGAVRFVWFGGHPAGTQPAWPLRHDVRQLGLDHEVTFVGEVADLGAHLDHVDVFVSAAREDAYPLVCAEACAAGVPVVAFAGGGAEELIRDSGAGRVVDYPDLEAMADEVADLALDHERRTELGRLGADFAAEHLDPSRIATDIERWLVGSDR